MGWHQMIIYEIKKIISKISGKIAIILLLLIVVGVSIFTIKSLDFVRPDGTTIYGIKASQQLRNEKDKWRGYITSDVLAEVIRRDDEIEASPEAQSKDWKENNKAYAKKQGYLDIRDIINSALSSFREYNYYKINEVGPEAVEKIYSMRTQNLEQWLISDEAKDRYTDRQKRFFINKYNELKIPLYYEDADGWRALMENFQLVIMLTMLILSFLVCRIFSGEYYLNADAVFFSSLEGRRNAVKAKIIGGLILVSVLYWMSILLYSFLVLCTLGSRGWNCMIQTSLYGWKSFYNITFLENFLLTIIGGYIGTLFILIAEMLISIITKSSITSISVPFILLFLPSFFGNLNSFQKFLGLMPDQLLQIPVAVRLFNAYEIGNTDVGALPVLFVAYPILFIVMIPLIYEIYRKAEIY